MSQAAIDVFSGGTVRLGSNLICDGYAYGYEYRVQTHVHDDHMSEFDRSKGEQDLFMSRETRQLLIAERDLDLEFRENLIPLSYQHPRKLRDGSELTVLRSGHMLGSCQVALKLSNGVRCGYSGDFAWPLEDVIQVDQLVVDSTYGSPRSVRRYTQAEAEACLLEVISQALRRGSVHVKAYRGTVERVLQVLAGSIGVPVLASEQLIGEIEVYQQHGFGAEQVVSLDSREGIEALKERFYVQLYSKGDTFGNLLPEGTIVSCSAYMVGTDHPLLKISDRAYRVALSNHADFQGTLEYVAATGATVVVTDNTRSHGVDLAMAINQRLSGFTARPSSNERAPH